MMKAGFKITEITAFISTDEDGTEGVCGVKLPDDSWLPFVCADPERVDSLREVAKEIAKHTKREIVLAKFEVRKNVEVIKP